MKVSNCCNAEVFENSDICKECYEHCVVIDTEEDHENQTFIEFDEVKENERINRDTTKIKSTEK